MEEILFWVLRCETCKNLSLKPPGALMVCPECKNDEHLVTKAVCLSDISKLDHNTLEKLRDVLAELTEMTA